jgi:hypothetical protein
MWRASSSAETVCAAQSVLFESTRPIECSLSMAIALDGSVVRIVATEQCLLAPRQPAADASTSAGLGLGTKPVYRYGSEPPDPRDIASGLVNPIHSGVVIAVGQRPVSHAIALINWERSKSAGSPPAEPYRRKIEMRSPPLAPSRRALLAEKERLRNRERPQPFQFLARQTFGLDDLHYETVIYVMLRTPSGSLRTPGGVCAIIPRKRPSGRAMSGHDEHAGSIVRRRRHRTSRQCLPASLPSCASAASRKAREVSTAHAAGVDA